MLAASWNSGCLVNEQHLKGNEPAVLEVELGKSMSASVSSHVIFTTIANYHILENTCKITDQKCHSLIVDDPSQEDVLFVFLFCARCVYPRIRRARRLLPCRLPSGQWVDRSDRSKGAAVD